MLLSLSLNDFVIVDQLKLHFDSGFTVLTGETGAGKSITLDAIGLLLGDKADYSQVRSGSKEAQLSALFDISELSTLKNELQQQGLLEEGMDELSIRRIIDAKGKSRSFINQHAVTLAQLKQIGSQLIDIHGQNAHHSLNQESAQRDLLDAFAGNQELANEVKSAFQNWQSAQKTLQEAQNQSEQIQIERERLEWQFNEISKLNPQAGEWENLSQSYDSLAHAAELLTAAQQSENLINDDQGIKDLLYQCQKTLQPLAQIEPLFQEAIERLAAAEAEVGEALAYINDAANRAEVNPEELANKEERMADLLGLARKYRLEPSELPNKLNELDHALQQLEASSDVAALEANCTRCEQEYMNLAQRLSAKRHQAADRLSQETADKMQELAMKGAKFHIELLPSSPAGYGLEQVQYQVAANKGTPLRPLNKVASGGELARISLALQVVTSRYTQVPTLIFDEVDTGIGGGVAEIVGKALRSLGGQHQVLAVTHLAQVAACGEQHWQVSKSHDGEQTTSQIKVLDKETRIQEIARMLGGETITDTSRQHAAELLQHASA
ncbi:MAG: DNA repair protein RecN [Neisseria sp.]|nr:DNA repair protein RecN [Neisseria sp.]